MGIPIRRIPETVSPGREGGRASVIQCTRVEGHCDTLTDKIRDGMEEPRTERGELVGGVGRREEAQNPEIRKDD